MVFPPQPDREQAGRIADAPSSFGTNQYWALDQDDAQRLTIPASLEENPHLVAHLRLPRGGRILRHPAVAEHEVVAVRLRRLPAHGALPQQVERFHPARPDTLLRSPRCAVAFSVRSQPPF